VAVGGATAPHYHPRAEEIYYILRGAGSLRIDEETRDVGVGDAIAIPPGAVHTIRNTGDEPLIFLCCCAHGVTEARRREDLTAKHAK
jgi:mannose-6-phosphate isomerase-like protein (cupin superfamily)